MTLYEFNILSFEEKQAVLWKEDNFIENNPSSKSNLEYLSRYGINKFYVELVYNIDTNKIVEVRSSKTGKDLEKHLPDIKTEY